MVWGVVGYTFMLLLVIHLVDHQKWLGAWQNNHHEDWGIFFFYSKMQHKWHVVSMSYSFWENILGSLSKRNGLSTQGMCFWSAYVMLRYRRGNQVLILPRLDMCGINPDINHNSVLIWWISKTTAVRRFDAQSVWFCFATNQRLNSALKGSAVY